MKEHDHPADHTPEWSARIAGMLAGLCVMRAERIWPDAELDWLAGAAAKLTGWFAGSAAVRTAEGWALPDTSPAMLVTAACGAGDFLALTTAIFTWQFACLGRSWATATLLGGLAAFPVTVVANFLRLLALSVLHERILPHLPERFGAFLHLLTGVAVFLPALLVCHVWISRRHHARLA